MASDNTSCWVFEMDDRAYQALRGEPRRLWRRVLLSALWFQLRRADEQLARILRGGEAVTQTDAARLRSALRAYSPSEG